MLALLVLVKLLLLVVLAADLAVVMAGLAIPANKALLAAIRIKVALVVVVVVAEPRPTLLKRAVLAGLQICVLLERRGQLTLRAALVKLVLAAAALAAAVVVVLLLALAALVVWADKMAAAAVAAAFR